MAPEYMHPNALPSMVVTALVIINSVIAMGTV
jgi:hypothetical protein